MISIRSIFRRVGLAAVRLACATLLAAQAHVAIAHTGGLTGFATISIDGKLVRYNLTLSQIPPGPLAQQMHLDQSGTTPDYRPLITAISEKIRIASDGVACAASEARVVPPTANSVSMTGTVDFKCADRVNKLTIHDDMSDVIGPSQHTLAAIQWTGGSQQFAFGADARETTIAVSHPPVASRGAGSFFPLGIEHILTGYDHLLFLLALMLCGGGFVSLLKIITAFTVAHSITLALAALDLVVLPSAFVESVIALSIAYVAFENLLPRFAASRRWAVSFVFGLMHGFGFSSVLREIGLPKENLLLSLLNFNLGVEVGQLTIVALAAPILLRFRNRSWEPHAVTAISAVIFITGLVLFIERAFLGG
ncbi:MAG TPA: HupE/UreJ family protein [Burkholderiales bacterium]|nr:HupE/UreJ family protein [Burkholderiales bacterium]